MGPAASRYRVLAKHWRSGAFHGRPPALSLLAAHLSLALDHADVPPRHLPDQVPEVAVAAWAITMMRPATCWNGSVCYGYLGRAGVSRCLPNLIGRVILSGSLQ